MRPRDGATPGGHPGPQEHVEPSPIVARAITDEVKLATEFLATLPGRRAPWLDAYEAFAEERRLTPALRVAVRLTILKLRTFGATEAYRPRPRRRRC